jgi:hypothetical protein
VIHDNNGIGRVDVDIGQAGPTVNDVDDADSCNNNVQNYPEVVSASRVGNALTITYRVDTTRANATYPLRVDIFKSMRGGAGELLAQDEYPEASAQAERTIVVNLPPGVAGIPFVAMATDADDHSSEFSRARDVLFEDDFD